MVSAIETRGLSKRYGRTVAVDGLDLAVESGSVFGFLGPNGAGALRALGTSATVLAGAFVGSLGFRVAAGGLDVRTRLNPDRCF